jgi:ribosomal protein S18 acetylase RimI-like enzyme
MEENEVEEVRDLMFKVLSRKSNKKYANSKSSFTVVATLDSDIVGAATVYIHDDDLVDEKTYFISNLCVLPDYQRMGVATRIVDFIEETGKNDGIKYVYTLVPVKYYETNKLYEKLYYDIKNINCYRKEL